jgi:hypothetical protein
MGIGRAPCFACGKPTSSPAGASLAWCDGCFERLKAKKTRKQRREALQKLRSARLKEVAKISAKLREMAEEDKDEAATAAEEAERIALAKATRKKKRLADFVEEARFVRLQRVERAIETARLKYEADMAAWRLGKLPKPFVGDDEPTHYRTEKYVEDPRALDYDTPPELRTPAYPTMVLGGELSGLDEVEDLEDLISIAPPWTFTKPKYHQEELKSA